MPTMVERFFDAFLKLQGIDNPRLDAAFAHIDSDFLKLSTANADTLAGAEHELKIKHDFNVIGDTFRTLGRDFDRIATLAMHVDQFVIKFTSTSPNGGPTTSSVDVHSPQADFLVLDQALQQSAMDLKIAGADFLKIDTARTPDDFQARARTAADDFYKLSQDMSADHKLGATLAADVGALGNVDNPSPLDLAYKELGGELMTVAQQFGNLSGDFGLLLPAVQKAAGGGGGAGTNELGGAFITLFQDFHLLNSDLRGIAPTAATVVNDVFHQSFTGAHGSGGGGGAG